MFKIFLDLEFPFKVDTCIYHITGIAKRYLRAKREKFWRSFSVDLLFPSKVDKWQMFENSVDLPVHLIRFTMVLHFGFSARILFVHYCITFKSESAFAVLR